LPSASPTRSPVCQEPSDGFCIWGVWDCDECKCVCFPGWSVGPDGSCSQPITTTTGAATSSPSKRPSFSPITLAPVTDAPVSSPPTASCQEPYPDFCLNGDWSVVSRISVVLMHYLFL
jgi:hypothetical protein